MTIYIQLIMLDANISKPRHIPLRQLTDECITLFQQPLFCSNQSPYPKAHEHKNEGFDYNEDPDVNLLIGHSDGSRPNLKQLNAVVK